MKMIRSKKSTTILPPRSPCWKFWTLRLRVYCQTCSRTMNFHQTITATPCSIIMALTNSLLWTTWSNKIRSSGNRMRWKRMRKPSMTSTTPISSTTSKRRTRKRMNWSGNRTPRQSLIEKSRMVWRKEWEVLRRTLRRPWVLNNTRVLRFRTQLIKI